MTSFKMKVFRPKHIVYFCPLVNMLKILKKKKSRFQSLHHLQNLDANFYNDFLKSQNNF